MKLPKALVCWILKNPPNHLTISLARSVLALGTLLSLLFNPPFILFQYKLNAAVPAGAINTFQLENYNLFILLGNKHLSLSIIIAILILVLVISGFFPKITCILHWWVSFSYFNAATLIEGGDQITMILTFFLIPIILTQRKIINHWHVSPRVKSNFNIIIQSSTYMMIRLQISLLYLHAAVGKLKVDEWVDGTALYYWFLHPTFGIPAYLRPIIEPIINSDFLMPIITWGVIATEFIMFSALVTSNAKYKYFLLMGTFFHLAIVFIHGLPNFFLAMLGGLILYLGGDWLEQAIRNTIEKWKLKLYLLSYWL